MLKSPVISKLCGMVAAEPRKDANSSRNFERGAECFEENGGRQILKIVSLVEGSFRVTEEDSNEEKLGQEVDTIEKWSRIKKAVPPP